MPTATENLRRFDVFLSYSRKDGAFARHLERALESYAPPRDLPVPQRHLNVCRDETDFTGVEYHSSVQQHLLDSSALVVVCSPHARASLYVDGETRQFAEAHGPERIIPILIGGVPNNELADPSAGDAAFPEALCEALSTAGDRLPRHRCGAGPAASTSRIVTTPAVGGLHHRHERVAA